MSTPKARPNALEIVLSDGRVFTVPPPTRRQFRDCMEIERRGAGHTSPLEISACRAAQLGALTRGSGLPADELTPTDEIQILHAIMEEAGAYADAEKTKRVMKSSAPLTAAQRLAGFDEDTRALALHQRCAIEQAERQPFTDSILLLETIYQDRKRQSQWDAALHDKTLR